MKIIICYDIEDDRDRYRLVKYLESFAYRLQYSVFECELTTKELKVKQSELSLLLADVKRPKVAIIPVCNDCASKIWQIGSSRESAPRACIIL